MDDHQRKIDKGKARKLLDPGGAFSQRLKNYEFRAEQQEMLSDVVDAYNENQIALIEAGTGIGKSIAYLLPAILWSQQNSERTLISTNTIALQEQLLKKDIPLAAQTLGFPIKAVLVKGMANYLCLRKLSDALEERRLFSDKEGEEIEAIHCFSEYAKEGSLSELPITPSFATWERVSAEGDTCTKGKCPFFSKCFFFNARKDAEDAKILISNHALLFADLAFREQNEGQHQGGLIPEYRRVILDEAHNIERIATEFFAEKASYLHMTRWLGKLGTESHGKLPLLGQKLLLSYLKNTPPKASSIHTTISIDLAAKRRELLQLTADTFDACVLYLQTELMPEQGLQGGESKLRLLPKHTASQYWQQEVLPKAARLIEGLKGYIQSIRGALSDFLHLDNPKLEEQTEGLRQEIQAYAARIEQITFSIEKILLSEASPSHVKWMEAKNLKTMVNISLINADLDISKRLVRSLFLKFPTTVLCSATLTTNQNFDFVKKTLGLLPPSLGSKALKEKIYPSPFDYTKQALLLIPGDMPNPHDPKFIEVAAEKIWLSLEACSGGAFLLFTSYGMLKKCHDLLAARLEKHRFSVFKQGDSNRSLLLEKFKHSNRAVLFGTDSFWEGVDVVGDSLKCVIIVKLPFKVPSEPIIEARSEAIALKGGDPFFEYSVPNAIVKFKQGFGRLIRNKNDRGCIVCLDPRLIKKNYGGYFIKSLPQCSMIVLKNDEELQLQMKSFYKKSFYLTKRSK